MDVGTPKRNVVENNVSVEFDDWLHTPDMEPYLDLNRIENNLVFEELAEVGFVDAEQLHLQLCNDSIVYERLPGFKRIPFEKIGTYQDGFRRN